MFIIVELTNFTPSPMCVTCYRILEIHAFLVEMVSNFRFEHVLDPSLIRRESSFVMTPVVVTEMEKGTQLPLRITRVGAN